MLAHGEWDRINSSFIGESTVVNLGDRRYLFALIGVPSQLTVSAFGDVPPGYRDVKDWSTVIETLRERRPLPREAWPRFVTFDDVTDPTTVRQVNPDNLEPRFGPGYRIASIELELTGEPVTRGRVEAVLPWIYDEKWLTNPTWAKLPDLVRRTILGLRQPGGVRKG